MQHLTNKVNLLFEASWEVCNKIGGIYTVLSTKANVLEQSLSDSLVFIGPDVWSAEKPCPVFVEDPKLLGNASSRLQLPMGITVRTGRWSVPGNPIALLVKFDGVYPHLNPVFGEMWNRYHVDSLHGYGDYNEGCAFGIASAVVIDALVKLMKAGNKNVVAHFDEWTSAMGLLYLQTIAPLIATVFTTHATSIGRSICGNGKPLYDYFTAYNGDQMAAELNMQSKHSLEKAAAHAADCFTTVSEVTARECEQLLEIRPQVVTPNGFEPGFVPGRALYAKERQAARARILGIAAALTGRTYTEDAFILATSGRNEYRNKGLDLFIDSCVRAREEMPLGSRGIIALILVPAWVKAPSQTLLDNMKTPDPDNGVTPDFMTHRLNNEDQDAVTQHIISTGHNGSDLPLTIIYVPCYLDGHDGVLDIEYYKLLPGIDLTVFPSYYEPWGYTPLESIAFGVPTVSTDKAGFGQWILGNTPDTFAADGAHVVTRTDSNYTQARDEIAADILRLSSLSSATLKKYRAAAASTAALADWAHFIKYYDRAFGVALQRRSERLKN
ncbi:MAG: glycogen/starch synthase [Porphyromonadaceae bacterium]|nr:glycogen/starch synthase [Porphyromonadaceae bacterium]